jgi:hypothetical protein
MANNTAQQILSASSNLLGFCLFVITALHATNKADSTLVDEFTSIIALFLSFSSLFSFVSIRTKSLKKKERHETYAEYLFVFSLLGIIIVIFLLVFGVMI